MVLALIGMACLLLGVGAVLFWSVSNISQLSAQTAGAEQRVTEIVNQPVTHLARSGPVKVYSPGWFHPGAIKPDFSNADIRKTQEFIYQGHVSSDLNPSEMFAGDELEFNRMTKYFYADLTLPKKRLSESEMVEINSLYRTIGDTEGTGFLFWLVTAAGAVFGACILSAMMLIWKRLHSAANLA